MKGIWLQRHLTDKPHVRRWYLTLTELLIFFNQLLTMINSISTLYNMSDKFFKSTLFIYSISLNSFIIDNNR